MIAAVRNCRSIVPEGIRRIVVLIDTGFHRAEREISTAPPCAEVLPPDQGVRSRGRRSHLGLQQAIDPRSAGREWRTVKLSFRNSLWQGAK